MVKSKNISRPYFQFWSVSNRKKTYNAIKCIESYQSHRSFGRNTFLTRWKVIGPQVYTTSYTLSGIFIIKKLWSWNSNSICNSSICFGGNKIVCLHYANLEILFKKKWIFKILKNIWCSVKFYSLQFKHITIQTPDTIHSSFPKLNGPSVRLMLDFKV